MVIVHIANIDTSIIGGVQIAVPKMIKAQSSHAEVCLINTHGDIIDGIETIVLCNGKFAIDKLPPPFCNPDIVVFHELYRFEYMSIYKELLKHGIPYIIVPHGCLSKKAQQKKHMKKIAANIIFFGKFLKKARLIQYLSDSEKKLSVFKKLPFLVMGSGVSIPIERKSSFDRGRIRFVYVGRLEVYIKGLDLLLTAIKKSENFLRQHFAIFEIYGPDYAGSHELILQMIQALNIEDLVRLNKEKMGIEKKEILLSATCFIQTSRTEGLPLGPLEALSYGVPCIVTHGVGLGDIIESYGAGYQSENSIEGISRSIELFIQNVDNSEEMAQSAIRLVGENFDIDVIAKKTIDEYWNILN